MFFMVSDFSQRKRTLTAVVLLEPVWQENLPFSVSVSYGEPVALFEPTVFDFGFGFSLLVCKALSTYAKHAQYCQNNCGAKLYILSRIWSRSCGFEKGLCTHCF